jgi:hypothetical protein
VPNAAYQRQLSRRSRRRRRRRSCHRELALISELYASVDSASSVCSRRRPVLAR